MQRNNCVVSIAIQKNNLKMALNQLNIFNYIIHPKALNKVNSNTRNCLCMATSNKKIVRRSANYKPNPWDYDFLTTLNNGYQDDTYLRLAGILQQKVGKQLEWKAKGSAIELLELVNEMQRLGIGNLFEEDIKIALNSIRKVKLDDNLHATALHFRILRQHGFQVSQDVFKCFMDPHGNFRKELSRDVEGMLSLYEASYLGMGGEVILDEAKFFAHTHLKDCNRCSNINKLELVKHALEVPLHLNMIRLETRWYIDAYSRRKDADLDLLELASLYYNIVQAIHQKEFVSLIRWWKNLGLTERITFSRDRLELCFLAAVGVTFEPQNSNCREGLTKLFSFINVIDDLYDVYSTLEEAKLFTDAIARWDVNSLEKLPDYMKIFFIALHNATNEIAYHALKDTGVNVIPYLKKLWYDQCKSYLLEAEWFHTGYKPTLEEYLGNGWLSVTAPLQILYLYLYVSPKVTMEALHYIVNYPDLSRSFGMVLRLIDDMGTYESERLRGDVLKSVQCYMNDKGVTEEAAREYISHLLDEEWKNLNSKSWVESPLPEAVIKAVLNIARATKTAYISGDPCNDQEHLTDKVSSVLIDSVPMLH